MTQKEIYEAINKWYEEYTATYNKFPTWGEMVEVEKSLDKEQ